MNTVEMGTSLEQEIRDAGYVSHHWWMVYDWWHMGGKPLAKQYNYEGPMSLDDFRQLVFRVKGVRRRLHQFGPEQEMLILRSIHQELEDAIDQGDLGAISDAEEMLSTWIENHEITLAMWTASATLTEND